MPRFGVFALLAAALAAGPAQAQVAIYGLRTADAEASSPATQLVTFSSANPGSVLTIGNITGLVSNHVLRTIDFRPSTGQLYALSTSPTSANTAQLYTVNLTTGALTTVGAGFLMGSNSAASVDMDFNPVTDTIRVVSTGSTSSGQNNYRVNPATGAFVATDAALGYVAGDPNAGLSPQITAVAHTNSFAGATSTTLFAWDYLNNDTLARVGGPDGSPSPDGGGLTTIQDPGDFITGFDGIGMDIGPVDNTLYATRDDNLASGMYLTTRNLTTGLETVVGAYPAGTFITSIAVSGSAPVPEPGLLLLAAAAAGIAVRRRLR